MPGEDSKQSKEEMQPAPENPAEGGAGTVEEMIQQLKNLQKGKHTLDLACCIFSDTRVRSLGYMFLDVDLNNYLHVFNICISTLCIPTSIQSCM